MSEPRTHYDRMVYDAEQKAAADAERNGKRPRGRPPTRLDAKYAEYQACNDLCANARGVEQMQCEVACLSEPDDAVWKHANHLAQHKYGLSGRDMFVFAYAFFLGEKRKEYEPH